MAESKRADALVTFLLDRTGSMNRIKSETIDSFNEYLTGLQADPKGILFTLLTFDTVSIDKVYVAEPVENVKKLDHESFQPRAATPLIDAAVKTIRAVEASLKERDDNPKIIICIQTDGLENSSREHDWNELNDLIKEKTKAGWEFIFLGVGIDAYQQGVKMGISVGGTVSTTHDLREMRAAYSSSSANIVEYIRGRRGSTMFTEEQKLHSGDRFDPSRKATDGLADKLKRLGQRIRLVTSTPTPDPNLQPTDQKKESKPKTTPIVEDFEL